MSVCVALKDKTGVWVGSESQMTDDDSGWLSYSDTPKFIRIDDFVVMTTGAGTGERTLRKIFGDYKIIPSSSADIETLASIFEEAFSKEDDDISCMVVTQDDIWSIIRNVVSYHEAYGAIGCGASAALGSLFTTYTLDIPAKERVETAIRAACDINAFCGGPIHIDKV